MNKYHIHRDTRQTVDGQITGRRMSRCITAESREIAQAMFEEAWSAVEPTPVHQTIPAIDWGEMRRRYLSPAALELKRKTPIFR